MARTTARTHADNARQIATRGRSIGPGVPHSPQHCPQERAGDFTHGCRLRLLWEIRAPPRQWAACSCLLKHPEESGHVYWTIMTYTEPSGRPNRTRSRTLDIRCFSLGGDLRRAVVPSLHREYESQPQGRTRHRELNRRVGHGWPNSHYANLRVTFRACRYLDRGECRSTSEEYPGGLSFAPRSPIDIRAVLNRRGEGHWRPRSTTPVSPG
jgi:hypothetical protein